MDLTNVIEELEWIYLFEEREKWRAVVSTIMDFRAA
jgi:hypothetical protein